MLKHKQKITNKEEKMGRKILIAGNWKMNGLLADGTNLAKGVAEAVKKLGKPQCEFLVCPPFTLLTSVKKALRGAKVALGAQDCHFAEKGAHTGDISPVMLKDCGCQYVILGHSERRANHGESSELVNVKAQAAHAQGLKTIICVGETLAERDEGKLGKSNANRMRILYGGSVKPNNAKELLSLEDVDGALIGGASLKVEDFLGIAQNAGVC